MKYFLLKFMDAGLIDFSPIRRYDYLKTKYTELKEQKAKFKKLATDKSLTLLEMYNLLMEFYDFDRHQLVTEERERIAKEYPNFVTIKTDYMLAKCKGEMQLAQLRLRVKDGIRLSKRKVYTREEVEELLNSGNVKFYCSLPYGKLKRVTEEWDDEKYPLLADGFGQPVITQEEFAFMLMNNPIAHADVFININMQEILDDYQNKYLPEYRETLKYMATFAQEIKAEQAKELVRLDEEKQLVKKTIDDAEKLKRQISDATKGR